MMGFAFGLDYVGLCGLVLGGIALIWALLILAGSWQLTRQHKRFSDESADEPSQHDSDSETPLRKADDGLHEHDRSGE